MDEPRKPEEEAGDHSLDEGRSVSPVPVAHPDAQPRQTGSPGKGPPEGGGGGSDGGDSGDEEPDSELGGRMTFLEHLDELRRRILHAFLAIVIVFPISWVFREPVYGFLAAPIEAVLEGGELFITKPTEAFTIYLKISLIATIFVTIPYILLQTWLFIAPGLYRREKLYALPFLISSTLLFLAGGAFGYYIILPPALRFLVVDLGARFNAIITAVHYFDFALVVLLGMGVIFQLPVLVAFLSIFGLITPAFMWRNFRYAFLVILIVAAVVSPTTDVVNLFLWCGPMVVLYVLSIGVSWIFQRKRRKRGEGP